MKTIEQRFDELESFLVHTKDSSARKYDNSYEGKYQHRVVLNTLEDIRQHVLNRSLPLHEVEDRLKAMFEDVLAAYNRPHDTETGVKLRIRTSILDAASQIMLAN